MSKKIEFFYDYVSIYSYLANSQLGEFSDSEWVYRPMFLGGVMQATGNRPPATVKPKGRYLLEDVDRWVSRYAIVFNMNPVFPQNTINALRVAIVSQHRGEFQVMHKALFDAMWADRQDLSDKDTLASVIERAGLSAAQYMDEIGQQEIKDELKANTEEAVQRGVFGAPTFFVGEQMFFGNDRFDFIAEAIADQAVT
jgi:2-hydroxychromene-2-carboxylate isomerase